MNKTIGILAHVDAGKTTFAEQVLYHAGSIRVRGRVDHKDSFLDSHDIEKERGITVFLDQAVFNYNSSTFYLLDTPGHADFSSEMERAIQAMDYAILIISAVEGVQGQTETIWHLLKKNGIPTFFFINKIDRAGADVEGTLEEIRANFTQDVCFITESFDKGIMNDELIEFIAERDEKIFDRYIEDGYDEDIWLDSMKNMIKDNKIYPVLSGSALQDIGIDSFIDKFDMLTFTEYSIDEEFSGQVYKIRHDGDGNKVTFIKALSGTLKVKNEICTRNSTYEKVNEIRIYNGQKFRVADSASAGELFAVTGLQSTSVGDGIGILVDKINYEMVPALKSKVIFDESLNPKDVLNYFKILEEEDPALNILWDEKLHEIEVHIMGVIQIEVLKQLVMERFNISVDFGPCEILYKETILEGTIGYGHFEPLRHYAEVHLKLEPGPRNSGITFYNECASEDLTTGNQNLIRTHIFEREHHGILTGSPVTDIKVTLLTGRAHNKHTCGGDFREATYRALRQGLESTKNMLLEPYYKFRIKSDIDYMGRIISDIQKLKGSFEVPETNEDKVIINGRGPVAEFMNYGMEFVELTKGRGRINFIFDGYDVCHNEEEIIKKIGYNKNADIEYTSSSIFCSKGQGFLVSGDEAKSHMHCLK